jgi:hypothetical protein
LPLIAPIISGNQRSSIGRTELRPCFVPHQVVIGNEHDTSTSSYLLNIFTDEEVGAYIDIDASQCGNEARFVNDFHGTGADGPNAQFWPYFDSATGEKRMSVKTTAPVPAGHEVLVDYGGRYFAPDSSEDSDMHASDEEFEERSPGKRGGGRGSGRGGGRRAGLGGASTSARGRGGGVGGAAKRRGKKGKAVASSDSDEE